MRRRRRNGLLGQQRADREHPNCIDYEAASLAAACEIANRGVDNEDLSVIHEAAATAEAASEAINSETNPRIAELLAPLLDKAQSDGRDLLRDIAQSRGYIDLDDFIIAEASTEPSLDDKSEESDSH